MAIPMSIIGLLPNLFIKKPLVKVTNTWKKPKSMTLTSASLSSPFSMVRKSCFEY